jgi:hypothetical protein
MKTEKIKENTGKENVLSYYDGENSRTQED